MESGWTEEETLAYFEAQKTPKPEVKPVGQAERFFIDYETFKSEVDDRFETLEDNIRSDLGDTNNTVQELAETVEECFENWEELRQRVDRLSVYGPQPREMPKPRLVTVLIRYPNGSTTAVALKDYTPTGDRHSWDVASLVSAIGQINEGS